MLEEIEKGLSPKFYLQRLAQNIRPKYHFEGGKDDFVKWKCKTRNKLVEIIGGFPKEKVHLMPKIIKSIDKDDHIQKKIIFQSDDKVMVSSYLLLPKHVNFPSSAILALHGHGRGKDDVVGIVENTESRQWIQKHNYDYAYRLVRKGYVVLAPDARGFGERVEGSEKGCYIPGGVCLELGKPVIGLRVWDDMRALDYLSSLPEVDANRIGCVGLSEGGKRTLYLAALDDRVKVAVISGYLFTWKSAIEEWEQIEGWDMCSWVPGLLQYLDYPDIAALIAPRPLLFERGKGDPQISLEGAKEAFVQVKEVYKKLGVEDKIDIDLFEGQHAFSGKKAFQWFTQWLRLLT